MNSRFSDTYKRTRDKKGGIKFFNMKTEPLTTKKHDYLKPVKVKKKGGYPRGTRPGDGGLAEMVAEMRYRREHPAQYTEEEEPKNVQQFDLLGDVNNAADERGQTDAEDADRETIDPEQPEDPNRAGLIRRVDGAHLVYKRQDSDGTYTELWAFYADPDLQMNQERKQGIIAGTDIDAQTGVSPDGSQRYEVWAAGNALMVQVTGLPN